MRSDTCCGVRRTVGAVKAFDIVTRHRSLVLPLELSYVIDVFCCRANRFYVTFDAGSSSSRTNTYPPWLSGVFTTQCAQR
jgi:hypothetical protein